MNKWIGMGRLTRDPELRYTPQGVAVTTIGVACNHRWKTPSGELKEKTTFVDVDYWGAQAEAVVKYFCKGKLICVEGRLEQDRWETPAGEKKTRMKVRADKFEFCGDQSKQSQPTAESAASPVHSWTAAPPPTQQYAPPFTPSDEDIPF